MTSKVSLSLLGPVFGSCQALLTGVQRSGRPSTNTTCSLAFSWDMLWSLVVGGKVSARLHLSSVLSARIFILIAVVLCGQTFSAFNIQNRLAWLDLFAFLYLKSLRLRIQHLRGLLSMYSMSVKEE